jgi:hypothetical protein
MASIKICDIKNCNKTTNIKTVAYPVGKQLCPAEGKLEMQYKQIDLCYDCFYELSSKFIENNYSILPEDYVNFYEKEIKYKINT